MTSFGEVPPILNAVVTCRHDRRYNLFEWIMPTVYAPTTSAWNDEVWLERWQRVAHHSRSFRFHPAEEK